MSDAADAHLVELDDAGDRSPGSLPVSELVGDDVQRVLPTATLREICTVIGALGVGIVGVGADGEALVGVVSERDVVTALAAGSDPDVTTAAEVQVEHLYYVDPSATVDEVAAEMLSRWSRHLFVGRPDELLGVVSARDVLGVYASAASDD